MCLPLRSYADAPSPACDQPIGEFISVSAISGNVLHPAWVVSGSFSVFMSGQGSRFPAKYLPGEGIEPPTFGLQNRCTTAVLTRPALIFPDFPCRSTGVQRRPIPRRSTQAVLPMPPKPCNRSLRRADIKGPIDVQLPP